MTDVGNAIAGNMVRDEAMAEIEIRAQVDLAAGTHGLSHMATCGPERHNCGTARR